MEESIPTFKKIPGRWVSILSKKDIFKVQILALTDFTMEWPSLSIEDLVGNCGLL